MDMRIAGEPSALLALSKYQRQAHSDENGK
jgi:hypothetical protein